MFKHLPIENLAKELELSWSKTVISLRFEQKNFLSAVWQKKCLRRTTGGHSPIVSF